MNERKAEAHPTGARGGLGGAELPQCVAVRSAPPRQAEQFTPDPAQAAVLAATSRAHRLVWGAAGTGKSLLAVEDVARRVRERELAADEVMVLAPTRTRAAALRDQLASRLEQATGAAMVRTATSLAFALLRKHAIERGAPAPYLLTGPEFDTRLADLLEGHAAHGGGPEWPATLRPEVRELLEFRTELRDLFMRAAEADLDAAGLAALGQRAGRADWVAAAAVLEEFEITAKLAVGGTPDGARRYHSSELIRAATHLLRDERESLGLPSYSLIVVDDFQEASDATAGLLDALVARGARLLVLTNPDVAVQSFRGALPGLGQRARERWPGPWGEFELSTQHRFAGRPALAIAARQVAEALPGLGPTRGARGSDAPVGTPSAGPGAGWPGAGGSGAGGPGAAGPGAGWPGAGGPGAGGPGAGGEVRLGVYPSPHDEYVAVAADMRRAHLEHGVAWNDMAVIVRTAALAREWHSALERAGVTVRVGASDAPLHTHDAAWPLLRCVDLAATPSTAGVDDIERLLLSVYGRCNSVELRRLRRALRALARSEGASRSSDELLLEAAFDPERIERVVGDPRRHARDTWARALQRVGAMLQAASEALASGVGPELTLWSVWQAGGRADEWRDAVLRDTQLARDADSYLDSVVALFAVASRAVDQSGHVSAEAFVRGLQEQQTAQDVLTSRPGHDGVSVLTPQSAAGQEWSRVYLCSVQDGTWPNVKLRSSLLGSVDLPAAVRGDYSPPGTLSETERAEEQRVARRAVIADELRFFLAALTRARDAVLCSAYQDDENAPSSLVRLLRRAAPGAVGGMSLGDEPQHPDEPPHPDGSPHPDEPPPPDFEDAFTYTAPRPSLDLRTLVADLRRATLRYDRLHALSHAGSASVDASEAHLASELVVPARLVLAHLAAQGVDLADPTRWYNARNTSTPRPLYPADRDVPLSPSTLENLVECTARWALQQAGGDTVSSTLQDLGTLIHELAAEHPDGDLARLRADFETRWAALKMPDTWVTRVQYERAQQMVEKLSDYLRLEAGPAVGIEARFEYRLHGAVVRGTADRVERADGGLRVVDFKTGKQAITAADAETNPQLLAYQLAVREGGLEAPALDTDQPAPEARTRLRLPAEAPIGGQLVYVGTSTKNAVTRTQPALHTEVVEFKGRDGEVERQLDSPADELLRTAAKLVRAPLLFAVANGNCQYCPVQRCCPLHSYEVQP
ncbi:ATP-dependent helicase [Micrococcales bacterium 31B]|nr:ATP-dependent helicase [Micrococcales bacterium 31B]